jgi:hypothetical protein
MLCLVQRSSLRYATVHVKDSFVFLFGNYTTAAMLPESAKLNCAFPRAMLDHHKQFYDVLGILQG